MSLRGKMGPAAHSNHLDCDYNHLVHVVRSPSTEMTTTKYGINKQANVTLLQVPIIKHFSQYSNINVNYNKNYKHSCHNISFLLHY